MSGPLDFISSQQAQTLDGLFRQRVQRSPNASAYQYYDDINMRWCAVTWQQMSQRVARWRAALINERYATGERVAVMLRNGCEWVVCEQAALSLGLVVVPLYVNDRPDNIAYILTETRARMLLIEGREHWRALREALQGVRDLKRVVVLRHVEEERDDRVRMADDWLPDGASELQLREANPDELATIVFTSGTTGRPKGVQLTHRNILDNAQGCQGHVEIYTNDLFLSFLPLSHMFERTVGYVLPMMAGAQVAFARSIPQLSEDLMVMRPTVLISVPRIYERVYGRIHDQLAAKSPLAQKLFLAAVNSGWRNFEYTQGRSGWSPALLFWPLLKRLVADKVMARLGGRVRVAVCGGAPLSPAVARLFIGLGLNLLQGYGMTETAPVVCANRPEKNIPASIGVTLDGVEVRISEEGELLTRSSCVTPGYWNNEEATRALIDAEGWLHTGDKARIDGEHVFITGRVKEIIVLSNGEKVPPADMELAITMDPFIEQAMVIGEGRPFLAALVVLNEEKWPELAAQMDIDPSDPEAIAGEQLNAAILQRIAAQIREFPGYAQIRRVAVTLDPWDVDNGLLTPTLKLRRQQIMEHFAAAVQRLYDGH